MRTLPRLLLAIAFVAAAHIASAATFTFRSTDAAGEGFNDPTPFTPVSGNSATTLGAARMNVLVEAGRIWGALIQSNVPILVDASFDPLTCSPTTGTLGSAGPRSLFLNFSSSVPADVFYVSALANSLAGRVLSSQPTRADIGATFNSAVDNDPNCLAGRGFYYGLDHVRGSRMDLLLVVMHELGHGLGFYSDVSLTTGAGTMGSDGNEHFTSYTQQIFDETLNRAWPDLTASERLASAVRTGNLAWNGSSTNSHLNRYTQGGTANGRFRLNAPATISTGSSVSHFDPVVFPNVLMEPNLPSITTSSVDITVCALQDIGWTVTRCPDDPNNVAPVATGQSVTLAEDTSLLITLIGTDANSDPLTYAVATAPGAGVLSAISSTTPRTITYTPNTHYNGADSFTFTVNDGSATSAPALISITVTPVNHAPTATDFTVSAQPGQAANITLQGADVDGNSLTYVVVTNPSHGTLSGSGADIVYQSTAGYMGGDSFTYRVNDGTVNSSLATVSINVQSPPQVTANSSSGGGGGALSFALLLALSGLIIQRRRLSL